ncbi:MAG: phosphoribosylanthranilate isomerase [Prevotella sp.]|nr:phosphoribosylanthranilate isomerase [Prevotella sp.]
MKIKVCGLRDAGNISQVAALGVDYIGMVFYPKSPRYVSLVPVNAGIVPDKAPDSIAAGTAVMQPQRVGVFVDEMPQNIITRVVLFSLDVIQLHGHETPTMIRNLRATLAPDIRPGIQLWKAVSISTEADFDACRDYEDCVDAFLFDTKCDTAGGSGRSFDWSLLAAYRGTKPFMLSGGIGPDDAGRIKALSAGSGLPAATSDLFMGIDLNSRFETAPAVKDVEALKHFLRLLH